MGTENSELVVKVSGDIKEFTGALEQAKAKTEDLDEQLVKIAKVSAVAFAAFAAEAYVALDAYKAQEQASNALSQAMQQQGVYSKELYDSYLEQAEGLEKLTGVDGEAIIKGQAYLQSMIGQQTISKELTKAVVDLAAAKKIDVFQAFELVGKAATNNTSILKRYGVEVVDTHTRSGNLANITKALSDTFGGQAEAATKGLGAIELLKVAYEDIQKAIGVRLAPAFTSLIKSTTSFFTTISENKPLLDFIVSLGVAGAVIAGLGTVVGTAGTAFLALKAALAAAQISMAATTIATRALVGATGIGLLILIATEIYLNWEAIWPRVYGVFKFFVEGLTTLVDGLSTLMDGVFSFDPAKIDEGIAKLKSSLSAGLKGYNDVVEKSIKDREAVEDKAEKDKEDKNNAGASKREAELRRRENLAIQIEDSKQKTILAKLEQANSDYIKESEKETQLLQQLADESNKNIYAQLETELSKTRARKAEAFQNQIEQQKAFNSEILASDEAFQALSLSDQAQFVEQYGATLRQQIQTKQAAEEELAKESLNLQIKSHNEYLKNQIKFGTAYANINKIMHSEIFLGTKSASTELAALQTSSNATLKGIGQFAAASNIAIKTAESAMNIYAGFSTIPIVGPALGVAGAIAAVAFGAEQVGRVYAAADGGLLTGGIPGRDSIPVMAMDGELMVPTRSYEEVVNAVADKRNAQRGAQTGTQGDSGGGTMEVIIGFADNAFNIIEQKFIQRRAIGVGSRF
jgi:hypothetical protein